MSASALGSSFCGVPKPLVPLWGRPLSRWAAEALAGADDELRLAVIPAGKAGENLKAALDGLGFQWVVNEAPERGLLSSFQVAILALPPGLDGAIFTLADMPLVSHETHTRLRQLAAADSQTAAVQCVYGGVSAPPMLLRSQLFPELLRLPPTDSGPRSLLRQVKVQQLPCSAAELLDIDTVQALTQAAPMPTP